MGDVAAVLSIANRPPPSALAGTRTPIERSDRAAALEFVIRVHADGRRERHARLFVTGPDGEARLERRPHGPAAAWAEQVIREEWIALRHTPRSPRH